MDTIKYLNEAGDTITGQKAALMDEYSIQYFEDGIVKKEEWYSSGALHQLTYFANETESLASITALHPNMNIYYNRQHLNNYTVYDFAYYTGAVLESKGKEVHDTNGDIIYSHLEDIETGRLTQVKKTVYEDEWMVYTIEYNDDGTIKCIDRYKDGDDFGGIYDAETILTVPGFSWEKLEYYKNALPLLPI